MNFWKEIIQEFIFQYRVFIKSIISHPILKHFYSNNGIYKILTTPSYGLSVINKWVDRCVRGGRNSADGCRASLKSLKKGVGSGSISQRYGSADPDPHPNVTVPQHCRIHWTRSLDPAKNIVIFQHFQHNRKFAKKKYPYLWVFFICSPSSSLA